MCLNYIYGLPKERKSALVDTAERQNCIVLLGGQRACSLHKVWADFFHKLFHHLPVSQFAVMWQCATVATVALPVQT